ncbi:MAG: carboxylesterase family protein [Gammaproteobacteria bacterium]|nr:carboxylesterase family protein [Gammaproteobacteria bacterium]
MNDSEQTLRTDLTWLGRISAMALLVLLTACGKPSPEVVANGETLQGDWDKSLKEIAVFRGIPFAKAPVGELRWRAPQAHAASVETRRVTEFAPVCPQGDYMIDWYAQVAAAFGHGPEVVEGPNGESEDCLYLNVWTPNLVSETRLPVMVYVHGGSNKGGWSYEPNYLGEQLAARGVVVVSIAYRVGPLGFFAHSSLENGAGEPVANFGLLDVAEAFRWIRSNIGAFGGDSNNVTGFGESAGAGNLLNLALATDQETPLFERIILQSIGGGLTDHRTLEQEQVLGEQLISELGFDDTVSAAQLREIPFQDLLRAGKEALPGHYYDAVVDGRSMVRQPLDGLRGPQAASLSVLAGTNRHEWLMYVDPDLQQEDLEQWIVNTVPEFAGTLTDAVSDEPDPRRAMDRLITAKRMMCPSRTIAGLATAAGGDGFVYWFTRQREGGDSLGVYHGAELPYVFNRHDDWLPTNDADHALTESLMSYWVSFANTGSVRTPGLPEWPMYVESRPWVMELGDQVKAIEPPDTLLCRYLSPR